MDTRNTNNQLKQPKTTHYNSVFPLVNGGSNSQQILSQNQQQGFAPPFATSLGTRLMLDNSEGPIDQKSQNEAHSSKNSRDKLPNGPVGPQQHEQYLPIANVIRIMRRGLPAHAKVADDAKELIQECVSEFISFITSEANEACQQEHRKTITAEDVIGAMGRLGFDNYVAPLMLYLQRYRESVGHPANPMSNVAYCMNTSMRYDSVRPGAAGLMHPTNGSQPPFVVVHPQYAMYQSAGNGGYYHDISGPSTGAMNVGGDSTSAVAVNGVNDPNSALNIGYGSSAGDGGAGPPGSSAGDPNTAVVETDFYKALREELFGKGDAE